ncbi:MAG: AAA family ATPase [Eubacteriales bacterium]
MSLSKIELDHFTVFDHLEIPLNSGINVFIGENGTGKTHIMKLLYCACRATEARTSFSHKIVRCFAPDGSAISRLTTKQKGSTKTTVKISATLNDSPPKHLKINFHSKTKKWDAEVTGEEVWEKNFGESLSSVFIPAKEILTHAPQLIAAADRIPLNFDDTYLDIITAATIDISLGRNEKKKDLQLKKLEEIIQGKVFFDKDTEAFYLKKGNSKLEFNLVSEGIKKIALLWQLAKNGALEPDSVLFWDEPEANINPVHIPLVVELLLLLQETGVQIFVATHSYVFAKYMEVLSKEQEKLKFHSLYKTADKGVQCETDNKFSYLENNDISSENIKLYEKEIERAME